MIQCMPQCKRLFCFPDGKIISLGSELQESERLFGTRYASRTKVEVVQPIK